MGERTPGRAALRCVGGTILSILLPGTGHLVLRERRVWSMALLAVLDAGLLAYLAVVLFGVDGRTELVELVADRQVLLGLGSGLLALGVTRTWAAVDLAWRARLRHAGWQRAVVGVVAASVAVAGAAPFVVAADYVRRTDRAVEDVFADTDAVTAYPTRPPSEYGETAGATTSTEFSPTTLPRATTTSSIAPTTLPPTTTTTTTLPPLVAEARTNILLLGGDAGPGRWSLRTDSMVVVSVDPVTGDAAMISVPRNLTRIPFPAGTDLAAEYPNGFPEIANAVYPLVGLHPELVGDVENPGAQAIKMAIAQLLGMPIHYYVLVDMAGFVDVVDALGGIDIVVAKTVPSPGNPPGAKHEVPPTIEAGPQRMDGTIALAYARSRKADSDYSRMRRQRCVLQAIAAAATPATVATGLPELVAAFGDAVRTDIPRDRLGEIGALADTFLGAGGLANVRTLHLAPPLIDPAHWSLLEVRAMVANVVEPTAPAAGAAPVEVPTKVLPDSC